jgi:hypothetical protein
MAYTKFHNPWTDSDPLSVASMNHLETQYDEAKAVYDAHTHSDFYTETEMDTLFISLYNDGNGSGADADLIYSADGNKHASDMVGLSVPTGLIILWYGSAGAVPAGWHLCDGAGGTVNLKNKFVVGAGISYSVGDSGGSNTFIAGGSITVAGHALTISEIPSHYHTFYDTRASSGGAGAETGSGVCGPNTPRTGTTNPIGGGGAHGHPGSTMTGNAVSSMPPYYALCYIQKI